MNSGKGKRMAKKKPPYQRPLCRDLANAVTCGQETKPQTKPSASQPHPEGFCIIGSAPSAGNCRLGFSPNTGRCSTGGNPMSICLVGSAPN